jgi:anti-sigma B factor antagonist
MLPPLFRVTTGHDADGTTIALAGELDLAGVTQFDEALSAAREQGNALTIDLSDLEFIDSSGLGVLVRFNNVATTEGFGYSVIAGPAAVHRAFVLSGLDRMLPFSSPQPQS